MKKTTLVAALLVANFSFSQSTYNLPPGSVLKSKTTTIEDYSYKLQFVNKASVQDKNENFLQAIPQEEMDEMKLASPEKHAYYLQADEFYKNLSPKVKNTFSVQELWDIYMFDQALKQKLEIIK